MDPQYRQVKDHFDDFDISDTYTINNLSALEFIPHAGSVCILDYVPVENLPAIILIRIVHFTSSSEVHSLVTAMITSLV